VRGVGAETRLSLWVAATCREGIALVTDSAAQPNLGRVMAAIEDGAPLPATIVEKTYFLSAAQVHIAVCGSLKIDLSQGWPSPDRLTGGPTDFEGALEAIRAQVATGEIIEPTAFDLAVVGFDGHCPRLARVSPSGIEIAVGDQVFLGGFAKLYRSALVLEPPLNLTQCLGGALGFAAIALLDYEAPEDRLPAISYPLHLLVWRAGRGIEPERELITAELMYGALQRANTAIERKSVTTQEGISA